MVSTAPIEHRQRCPTRGTTARFTPRPRQDGRAVTTEKYGYQTRGMESLFPSRVISTTSEGTSVEKRRKRDHLNSGMDKILEQARLDSRSENSILEPSPFYRYVGMSIYRATSKQPHPCAIDKRAFPRYFRTPITSTFSPPPPPPDRY